ncbi:sigma-70 family RNA polymerase sigma factor [Aquabacterium lacunae]|jgi:RNA polymerase sigma factor (sigma-70 family)|uniref:RNA polymerase sigma factor n=1 Tax=Aquabacterium lacunae TaxID=2528630 RepID=A0A4Q9H4G4_9BURK|nr:sigma-70 family RNA polymerase sigma factor [Aquabacterium lacunae]TBO30411.1 sigma-70 family RNA polymerase sigma factor [Aquabacterium lacunae]
MRQTADLAALLGRVALGDRVAFDTLYRASSSHLLGVILRIQHDRAQAEDVLQEVYINVWRAAQSYNAALANPTTWLVSIARNRAIDSLRRKASSPDTVSSIARGSDDEDEHDLLERMADDSPGPLEQLEAATRARSLERCMDQLSADQRGSLALAYYQGLSHSEVADQMGQPLGTVKSWVRRGMQSLKTCLERAAEALN